MKLLNVGCMIFLVFFCAACGDDASDKPLEQDDSKSAAPPVPSYEIAADGVECSEGATVTNSISQTGCTIIGCLWICADYQGQYPVSVNMHFRTCPDEGEEWALIREFVMDGDVQGCETLLEYQ